MAQLRLQVFLAKAGLGSRRKCEELITAGRVKVNGRVASELGTKVDPDQDKVVVGGRRLLAQRPVYLLLHKPRGYVTTASDPEGRPTVLSLLGEHRERVFSVGRLDFNTDGVLLLTNDGDLANALMHPRGGVPKTYHAKLRGEVPVAALDQLRAGVRLDDGTATQPAELFMIEHDSRHTWIEITIKEGKNRQVHRMADAIGFPLLKLTRVRYGNLTVEGLPPGRWRPLTGHELRAVRALASAGGAVKVKGKAIKKRAPARRPRG